jgi:LysR family hydrogen peroxide-inducible transcriptional activator
MNLQQLEYIVAVDIHRHFVTAAQKCFVTQATLSMMIKKLEEELGIKIFDRSKQPVVPTEIGQKVIAQAKIALRETHRIPALIDSEFGELGGEIKIGVIPTLSPYLLPLFLNSFLKKYQKVKLEISELTTDEITKKLPRHDLDVGILAIPLKDKELSEQSLFYEEFVVYASPDESLMQKKYVLATDIDVNRLWLLEEGHCLRAQTVNLCELKSRERKMHQLNFATGSLETLKKIVENNQGITILPQLALRDMSDGQMENIRYFRSPAPVREIGLVTYRHFVKEGLINALKEEILICIPDSMKSRKNREIVGI